MEVCGFILIICLSSCYFSARATNINEETLCVYMKSCVLPCRFTPGSDLYIQWIQTKGGLTVHSFHSGQNQDLDQHLDYRGRTSLFEEEMNTGNASLLLRNVTVEDQDRFLCLANDNVTYVNMKVFAPVSEVYVNSNDGNLTCHAHDIYPEPSLKWTINPEPSAEPQTFVNHTETGLFSVYSSVPLPPYFSYEYICTVSTEHSTKSKTGDAALDNHNLLYLWTPLTLILVLVPILTFVTVGLRIYWLKILRYRNRYRNEPNCVEGTMEHLSIPKMSHDDESGVFTQLNKTSCSVRESTDSTAPTIHFKTKEKCIDEKL